MSLQNGNILGLTTRIIHCAETLREKLILLHSIPWLDSKQRCHYCCLPPSTQSILASIFLHQLCNYIFSSSSSAHTIRATSHVGQSEKRSTLAIWGNRRSLQPIKSTRYYKQRIRKEWNASAFSLQDKSFSHTRTIIQVGKTRISPFCRDILAVTTQGQGIWNS